MGTCAFLPAGNIQLVRYTTTSSGSQARQGQPSRLQGRYRNQMRMWTLRRLWPARWSWLSSESLYYKAGLCKLASLGKCLAIMNDHRRRSSRETSGSLPSMTIAVALLRLLLSTSLRLLLSGRIWLLSFLDLTRGFAEQVPSEQDDHSQCFRSRSGFDLHPWYVQLKRPTRLFAYQDKLSDGSRSTSDTSRLYSRNTYKREYHLLAYMSTGPWRSPGSSSFLSVTTANVENANISNRGDLRRIAQKKRASWKWAL